MNDFNFLYDSPLANWLDYFLDRKKFFDLLANPEENESTIILLVDQFMEQAFSSEKEIDQMYKKQFDEDDIIKMRYKIDELWLCALSCFAALGWDLDLLVKSSNVIRIHALMCRLSKWVYKDLLDVNNTSQDIFPLVCKLEVSALSPKNLFPAWMFARWILLVDTSGRFPAPVAKPTVSNPSIQIDMNLVQADRISQAVFELRKMTPDAACLLNTIVDLPFGPMEIPNKNCFFVSTEAISTQSMEVLKVPPSPYFSAGCALLDAVPFRAKTHYDLMVAHFSARHFFTCRQLLSKVIIGIDRISDVTPDLARIVKIPNADFEGYKGALQVQRRTLLADPVVSQEKVSTEGSQDGSLVIIKAAESYMECPATLCVSALKQGSCVSRRLIVKLGQETFRNEFLEAATKQLSVLRNVSVADKQSRSRIITSLYFLCALCPGFSDALVNHSYLGQIGKWRQLAKASESTIPPLPSNESLSRLSETGPPLWNILTSFNLVVVRAGFDAITTQFKMPFRHHFSDLIGDAILNKCSPKNFNKVATQLWKLEQLGTLNNSLQWKSMINDFATKGISDILGSNSGPQLKELLAYELLRIEMDIWNRRFHRTQNIEEFNTFTTNLLGLAKTLVARAITTTNAAFVKIGLPLSQFLLNNQQWKFIADNMDNKIFKSPFIDFSRVLASYLSSAHETKDMAMATQFATNTFWKVMWPNFEATNPSRRQGPVLLTRHQLQDFLKLLKEAKVLDLFFGYASFLYNCTLPTAMEEEKAAATSTVIAYKRIYNEHEELWKQVSFDANTLDVTYIETIMEILCANAMIVNPVNASWLRICADFNFAKERYNEAATMYLEVIAATQRGFSEMNNLDAIYAKITTCCSVLQMPTLAVIVGQLRTDIQPHLLQVEWLLQGTPNTVDAGPAYFSLIASIELMEKMAGAYTKLGLPIYAQNLLKSMPTKAMNVNNSPPVLHREIERRKKRLLDILFNQFFKQNM